MNLISLNEKKSYFAFKTRKQMVADLEYVNEVILEKNWEQKIKDIKKYNVKKFVIGDDWKWKFDYLKDYGVEVIYLPRTEGISSSKIKKDLNIK